MFDGDRYFDVFVEYAKASPEDLLIEITVHNRGLEPATLHVLPTLWFRNVWSWGGNAERPLLRATSGDAIAASHPDRGERFLCCEATAALLFTENETNTARLFHLSNPTPYVKDGINNCIIHGYQGAVNPEKRGTKVSAHYPITIGPGASKTLRLRLSDAASGAPFGQGFNDVMTARRREADGFYAAVIPSSLDGNAAGVLRQAVAGMLWSKLFYYYDVNKWLEEHGVDPFRAKQHASRNEHWHHMYNAHVISMPDKWEYPWYAAWDLAFHVLALTLVDEDFGKEQLKLMLDDSYMHPSGQIPAYEWNFSDVNPPVHAWATNFTYAIEMLRHGKGDIDWFEAWFHKLALNFTWWVNRRTAPATTPSRAVSWDWTTSASSTAAHRCRPVTRRWGRAVESPLHGGAAPLVCGVRLRRGPPEAASGAGRAPALVPRGTPGADGVHPCPGQSRSLGSAAGGDSQRDQAPAGAGDDARREGVPEPPPASAPFPVMRRKRGWHISARRFDVYGACPYSACSASRCLRVSSIDGRSPRKAHHVTLPPAHRIPRETSSKS